MTAAADPSARLGRRWIAVEFREQRPGRRPLCRSVLLGTAVALAALGCSEGSKKGPIDAGATRTAAAHLESVKGEVKVERDGKLAPAQLGYLYVGDSVDTTEDAEAKVRYPGGRFVEVGPDARFTLSEGEGGLVLNVARGLVLTRVPDDAPRPGEKPEPEVALSILTPFGLTRIGKSEVAINVGKDSTRVEVRFGQIEMVSRNGEVTKAGAGDKLELGAKHLDLPVMQVVIEAAGKAELKKKDSKSWVPLKKAVLASGDAIRVKDGHTTLQAEGSATRLTFGKGAEVGFTSISTGGGLEVTDLDLKKGELSGVLPPKQKSRVKLGSGLTLVSDLGGQFSLMKTATGVDVNALAGDFKLEREGGESRALPGGASARVTEKAIQVSEPAKDQVALPTRVGLKVYQQPGKVSLVWDGEEGKPYRIEVASGPSFLDPLLSGVVHQRFVSVQPPARGNLYWRVFDGDKEIDHGSAYFSNEPKSGGELDLRRNEVQDGADKTTIYYQDKPPAVTFNLTPDANAAKYKVSVFKEGALNAAVVERTSKDEKLVLDGALAEGKYLWSVTPLDASGASLRGGKMNKLEIVYDNAVPNLLIKSPLNGDPGGASVRVAGIAPVGARVFVNGKAVALDDKARFDTTAAPLPGGRLVFRMVGKSGAEVYTVRTVRR